jgi:hypothetical protein
MHSLLTICGKFTRALLAHQIFSKKSSIKKKKIRLIQVTSILVSATLKKKSYLNLPRYKKNIALIILHGFLVEIYTDFWQFGTVCMKLPSSKFFPTKIWKRLKITSRISFRTVKCLCNLIQKSVHIFFQGIFSDIWSVLNKIFFQCKQKFYFPFWLRICMELP